MKTKETEKVVERYLSDKIVSIGGMAYKFNSPNRRFVPDRICVFPSGLATFVEVKGPKGKLHSGQVREIKRIRALGFWVSVLKSKADVDTYVKLLKQLIKEREKQNAGNKSTRRNI